MNPWTTHDTASDTLIGVSPTLYAPCNRSYEPDEILAMINSTDGLLMASALMVVFFGGSNDAAMMHGSEIGMSEFKRALDQTMGTNRER